MRFLLLLLPAGTAPVGSTAAYDDALRRAGILLAHDRLDGGAARVRFGPGGAVVAEPPPLQAASAVGGYWMIQARSRDEAVEWARRCPAAPGDAVEVHPLEAASS